MQGTCHLVSTDRLSTEAKQGTCDRSAGALIEKGDRAEVNFVALHQWKECIF